jgi:hypothetical protein
MANPTPTTRQTPSGRPLKDGFQVLTTFGNNPQLAIWEKRTKPPGLDGGDKIDQTTQHNARFRTYAPRALVEVTDGTVKCAYKASSYDALQNLIGQEVAITQEYCDGSQLVFWGCVKSFDADDQEEGKQPEATISYYATNWDPVNNVEAGPVYIGPTGTGTGTI